jgi:hypothetical protein
MRLCDNGMNIPLAKNEERTMNTTTIALQENYLASSVNAASALKQLSARVKRSLSSKYDLIMIVLMIGMITGCVYCLPAMIGVNAVKVYQQSIRDAGLVSFLPN